MRSTVCQTARPFTMIPITLQHLLPIVAVFLLAGCLGGGSGLDKSAVSALWIDPDQIRYFDNSVWEQLKDTDIQEIFLPLADLDLKSVDGPLVRRPMPDLEPSLRLNLVVSGKLELGEIEPAAAAETVGQAVEQLLFDVEARGILPIGVHFDLRTLDSIEVGTSFFKRLRKVLDPSFFLSISLRRSWMENPDIRSLARSVDFVVPFLYGQRVWERDSDSAWDFEVVKQRLQQLEEIKVPYMLGIIGIGNVTHTDEDGTVKNFTSEQALHTFMWNRNLELKRGFSLQATNRKVYTLVASESTLAGGWRIEPKDEIRLVRPMTTDLDQLLDLLAEGAYSNLLGQLYFRLPSPQERMSISVANILNALDASPIQPELDFEVQVVRRTRRGLRLRFTISNENGEPTDYSLLDNNYLQITTDPNAFGNIDVGDFYRFDLLKMQPDGSFERMFRQANVVRFHIPILDGQQKVVSGDVEVHRRNPVLQLDAKFRMPDGRTVTYGPYTWKNGELFGLEKSEEEDAGTEPEPPSG